jgi:transposase InsO family protein
VFARATRNSKFTREFDTIFRSEAIEIIRTPVRAPQANAVAERFIRTVRAECLDWLLIVNPRHLERALRIFVDTITTATRCTEHSTSRHLPETAGTPTLPLTSNRPRRAQRSPRRPDPRIRSLTALAAAHP